MVYHERYHVLIGTTSTPVINMSVDNYFEQQGSGLPIVFIHGSYATTATWKKMLQQLAKSNHCISIRLPGHGGAPAADDFSAPTIETELAIIEQVVHQVTDQPLHLVGHSYGGVVALAQALKGNLDLSLMTLFEPVAVWLLEVMKNEEMDKHVKEFLAKYREDVAQGVPYACGQVIDFWGGKNAFEPLPDFIKDGMTPLVANNIRHWDICTTVCNTPLDLQKLSTPTQVVCGSRSNKVAHAISDHLRETIPHSKKYVIEGASHFLVTSHVDECLSVLADSSIF